MVEQNAGLGAHSLEFRVQGFRDLGLGVGGPPSVSRLFDACRVYTTQLGR